ncbi:MAG: hypothetical protein CMF50_04170 [Legionellales bacterium]|nr:hypothetical protein [Legionellales bacterium]|tara:strand:- start:6140 stop:7633 length:1494 start_codon:yes stop_codon:yes gene_type:complete
MRKGIIIITTVLLLGGVLISPYLSGYIIERKLRAVTTTLPQSVGIDIRLLDYQRGWHKSKATYFVSINQHAVNEAYRQSAKDSQPSHPLGFSVKQVIYHGPIVVHNRHFDAMKVLFAIGLVESHINIPAEEEAFLNQYFELPIELNSQAVLSYDGTMNINLHSPRLMYQDKAKTRLAGWNNLFSRWQLSKGMKHIRGEVLITDAAMTGTDHEISCSNIKMVSEYQRGPHGFWYGETTLKLPFSTVAFHGQDKMIFHGVNLRINDEALSHVVNADLTINLDKMILNDYEFGPGVYSVKMKNIDGQSLQALSQLVATNIDVNANSFGLAAIFGQTLNLLPGLLGRGFQLQMLPVVLHGPNGKSMLQAWVTLPDVRRQTIPRQGLRPMVRRADAAVELKMPKRSFKHLLALLLVGDAKQQLNMSLVKTLQQQPLAPRLQSQVQAQINRWKANHLLVEQAQDYLFSITYMKNELYLNGHAVSPTGGMVPEKSALQTKNLRH